MLMNQTSDNIMQQNVSLKKYRVDKNRLLVVSMVNLLTILCAVFSMAFYEWIHITFAFGQREGSTIHVNTWINLLYGSVEQQEEYYLFYGQIQDKICDKDTFCLAIFYQLDFIGKLCFGIFAFGFLLSLYDGLLLIRYGCLELVSSSKLFMQRNVATNYKNNFRTVTMFVTYIVGLTLNFFAMVYIKLEDYRYGISFWVFLGSLIVYGLAAIYQNRKMSRISKQEMIIRLLENQKAILRASKISEGSQSDTFTI